MGSLHPSSHCKGKAELLQPKARLYGQRIRWSKKTLDRTVSCQALAQSYVTEAQAVCHSEWQVMGLTAVQAIPATAKAAWCLGLSGVPLRVSLTNSFKIYQNAHTTITCLETSHSAVRGTLCDTQLHIDLGNNIPGRDHWNCCVGNRHVAPQNWWCKPVTPTLPALYLHYAAFSPVPNYLPSSPQNPES